MPAYMLSSTAISNGLRNVLTVLWIGGLWVIGLLVAPILFQQLDPSAAGRIAGKLFHDVTLIGAISGLWLLYQMWRSHKAPRRDIWRSNTFRLLLLLWLLALLSLLVIFPQMAASKVNPLVGISFQQWHKISGVAYLLQCLLGLIYVIIRR